MPLARRKLLALAAIAAGVALAWHLVPSRWSLRPSSGVTCSIQEGLPRAGVLKLCGAPDAAGAQPKRGAKGPGLINLCSAPCDRYADRLLFYDCDGNLAEVEAVSGYQGCVLPSQ